MTAPALLTLKEAAQSLNAGMKEAALRKARDEGRLAVYRLGNKDYTTADALQEMLDQCRIHPKERGSISENGKVEKAHGSSVTQDARLPQASARQIAEKLRGGSRNTSPRNTTAPPDNVTPLKRGSRT